MEKARVFDRKTYERWTRVPTVSIVTTSVSRAELLRRFAHGSFWELDGCSQVSAHRGGNKYLRLVSTKVGPVKIKMRLFCVQEETESGVAVHAYNDKSGGTGGNVVSLFHVTDEDGGVCLTYEEFVSSSGAAVALGKGKIKRTHRALLRALVGEEGAVVEEDTEDVTDVTEELDQEQVPLEELLRDLQNQTQLLKTRKRKMKTYADAFAGDEVLDYLTSKWPISRATGVSCLNVLLERGHLAHVTNEHIFEDDHLFYQWRVPSAAQVQNAASSFKPPPPLPDDDTMALYACVALWFLLWIWGLGILVVPVVVYFGVQRGRRLERAAMIRSMKPRPPAQSVAHNKDVELSILYEKHHNDIKQLSTASGETDKLVLLRYILSFKSVEAAAEALRKAQAWREENAAILGPEPPEVQQRIHQCIVSGHHRFPLKDGSPLLVTRAGLSNLPLLVRSVPENELVDWLMWLNEDAMRECDSNSRRTGRLTKLIRVNDLRDASLLQDRGFLSALGKATKLSSFMYPQLVEANILLNAPSIISLIIKLATPFMSKGTMSKVRVCKGDTLRGELSACPFASARFEPSKLPSFMGGTCECNPCIPGRESLLLDARQ